MDIPTKVLNALEIARAARANAHVPYSNFKVGAAVQIRGVERAIGGANVENASFGATVCAERIAIMTAVVAHGKPELEFLVVVTDEAEATPPCALCLQVLAEFARDDLPVYLANRRGVRRQHTLAELLPHPFRQFVPGDL